MSTRCNLRLSRRARHFRHRFAHLLLCCLVPSAIGSDLVFFLFYFFRWKRRRVLPRSRSSKRFRYEIASIISIFMRIIHNAPGGRIRDIKLRTYSKKKNKSYHTNSDAGGKNVFAIYTMSTFPKLSKKLFMRYVQHRCSNAIVFRCFQNETNIQH